MVATGRAVELTFVTRITDNALPSSSPAFGTPVHPFNPGPRPLAQPVFKPAIPTILPILLPPASLRPLAFRTFTKKHNLTLSSSALQALATFVGRHCGSGWREEGTAEKVLDEIARQWKRNSGPVIVEDAQLLKDLLKTLEGCMSSGRIDSSKSGLSRQSTFSFTNSDSPSDKAPPPLSHQTSFGISSLQVSQADDEDASAPLDPRSWLSVLHAPSHPRFTFSTAKSHFLPITTPPSLLPPPSARTAAFRDRYAILHSLVLRNPAFQTPTITSGAAARTLSRSDSTFNTATHTFKLTPVANLLGRSGTPHLLLGLLTISPAGALVLQDPTGSIALDLAHARPLAKSESEAPWLYPGSIVLVEGVYREDFSGAGSAGLGGGSGVGGMIGGRFIGFSVGPPPVEKRNVSLGVPAGSDGVKVERAEEPLGGGFGWTAFLPGGSEKATGARMRRLEKRILQSDNTAEERRRVVIMSEVKLDIPECLSALRTVLQIYARERDESKLPLAFIVMGSFVSTAVLAEGKAGGSIEYKELFNALAAVLADFPSLLRASRWVFVPGDNDAWSSSFAAGSSVALPREPVPDVYTSRIKRVFRDARAEAGGKKDDALDEVWTSNPARVSLFGTAHEIALLRDDMASRMRRTAISYGREARAEDAANAEDADSPMEDVDTDVDSTTQFARKLVLSLLPQGCLAPFPAATRPVHWSMASGAGPLSLYPLPHTLVLADGEAPAFAVTYEGCHVMNPGRLVRGEGGGRKRRVGWVEYDAGMKRGVVKEEWM
ncbi:hypothetical protein K461DRAFT_285128 [Myriangium duriaei CBS 260.36]|uniref:DNA polymerase epsilon subunit B n=1 Tax=Myriangium duriaei CBS 260.36 TaxID=1168546 RepID=A0A9P4MHM0_9PEZI|nr:hypothetical protein K461DRAFT_285128 [Myriangium duriaei CBS 260.36]